MRFPSFDLTGKVGIVTGAGHGIGRTLGLGLANAGADVVVCSRTVDELGSLAEEVRAMGRRAIVQPADVTKLSDIERLADCTVAEFGKVDILINNAGMNINESALDVTEDHWDRIMDINLKGVFFCSQIF